MRKWKMLTEDEVRRDWDWRPCPKRAFYTEIDPDLAYIPGCDGTDEVETMVLVTAAVGGYCAAELNVIYRNISHDNIETYEGDSFEDACMNVCFNAATYDFFDRLDPLEFNCEDATNRLAFEALALWANESPDGPWEWLEGDNIYDLDWFMGKAREYVKENGPKCGIEWKEF